MSELNKLLNYLVARANDVKDRSIKSKIISGHLTSYKDVKDFMNILEEEDNEEYKELLNLMRETESMVSNA